MVSLENAFAVLVDDRQQQQSESLKKKKKKKNKGKTTTTIGPREGEREGDAVFGKEEEGNKRWGERGVVSGKHGSRVSSSLPSSKTSIRTSSMGGGRGDVVDDGLRERGKAAVVVEMRSTSAQNTSMSEVGMGDEEGFFRVVRHKNRIKTNLSNHSKDTRLVGNGAEKGDAGSNGQSRQMNAEHEKLLKEVLSEFSAQSCTSEAGRRSHERRRQLLKQVLNAMSNRSSTYNESSFKEAFVRSGGIEQVIKGCMTYAEEEEIEQFAALFKLVAHSSIDAVLCESLAALTVSCGILMGADSCWIEITDTEKIVGTINSFLQNGFSCNLSGANSSSPNDIALQKSLKSLQSELNEVQSTKDSIVLTKELVGTAQNILEEASLKSEMHDKLPAEVKDLFVVLRRLRTILITKQQEITMIEERKNKEQPLSDINRDYDSKEAALTAEEEEVQKKVQRLKEELATAEESLKEIHKKRAFMKKRLTESSHQVESETTESKHKVSLLSTKIEDALTGTSSLESILKDACREQEVSYDHNANGGIDDGNSVQQISASVLIDAFQNIIGFCEKQFQDINMKLKFYCDRLNTSSKQEQNLRVIGDIRALQEHKRQRESLQNMLSEVTSLAFESQACIKNANILWIAHKDSLLQNLAEETSTDHAFDEIQNIGKSFNEVISLSEEILSLVYKSPKGLHLRNRSRSTSKGSMSHMDALKGPGIYSLTTSGDSTPTLNGSESIDTGTTGDDGVSRSPSFQNTSSELSVLEHKLALLEAENRRKDEQIAAMLAAASVEIPTPPTSKKKNACC